MSTAPNITSGASTTVTENVTGTVYTGTATDPQGDAITWDVFSGADAGLFTISSSGALSFQESPNFDLPTDANLDNVYEVTIRARAGGEQDTQALRITVENDKEGIEIVRVLTGLNDPVAINWSNSGRELLIAERSGRVLYFDPETEALTEDTLVRDNRRPGEILAAFFGFADDANYGSGVILITHSPASGLLMQVFEPEGRDFQFLQIGEPWSEPVAATLQDFGGRVLLAIGDPTGELAQDASSPYGKLFSIFPVDPYAGASLLDRGTRRHRLEMIGDGIRQPGGFSSFEGDLILADQGGSIAHSITRFQDSWRPLDFGWPFYEGATAVRTDAPDRVNGPTLAYNFGEGRGEGTGVIAGISVFTPTELSRQWVFADVSGKIFSIPIDVMADGFLHFGNEFEDRTEDFEPDARNIDSPVAFVGTVSRRFILDKDGELFEIRGTS